MAEEDAFIVDDVEGGLCVDDTDAGIGGRCNSGSDKNKGKKLWDSLESKYMSKDSSSKKFLKDFKHTLKHGKDDLSLVQLCSHLRIEESLRAHDSDKGKGKEVSGPSVNMIEEECWKCGKTGHFKRDYRSGNKKNANAGGSGKGSKDHSQDQDSGATTHVCKDRCWFKIYEPVEDEIVLYMGDDHFTLVHGKGSVALEFSSGKTITLFNVLYVPKLRKNLVSGPMLNKCGYKQVYEYDKYILSKSGVFVGFHYYNNGMFMLNLNKVPYDLDSVYMSSSSNVANSSLWHARLGHVHYKRMLEMFKDDLIPAIDENSEKCTTCMLTKITRFCYVYLLHAKDETLDKFRIYKTEVELQQNDLFKTLRTDRGGEYYDPVFFQSVGIIHETTAPYTPQQNGVAKRKNRALKEMVNSMLSYSGLSEGFWGKAMLTACYLLNTVPNKRNKTTPYELWFYVIEPNDSVFINSIIKSRDAIFDENCFSSIPRPKDVIPNSVESQRDDHYDDVPSEIPEPQKGDHVGLQYSYCYSIEEDPRTYNEAMQSWDDDFWKEAVANRSSKRRVDGTIDKFKARLVIQGFRQKEGIDYFDTYAPVACITTIRLLLALASIHNLVIHQMDVKTAFLNGDLDEEVYMKQPEGFFMPGNEHKVCKMVKSLYGLKQAPKQWHQKFYEVVLSSGFLLNQSDKCVYSKIDDSGKGVIICLYVDDMLIFGTDQNQVDKTKKFLSSKFSMKYMGEADVILVIKIKRENKGIVITQSHYIEKILKKFNHEDCSPVSTPMDPVEKIKPNAGKPVDQLEYSRAIGCLMYVMTSTRPDIAYAVGRLSRFTSNPSRQHCQAITRVFKYLKVFLLGGGAISWASKKQTCITGSTMESEFLALAAAGKEAEWLRNLIHEIPIWLKPIASIFIRCDSAATLAKAYSQIYSGKSRHLGVRHSMIRELIMNGVISIEFVRSQQNLADHLTKCS
ncbi:zinc finger, CCHC-type containing protein [Tanacetum coccineum]